MMELIYLVLAISTGMDAAVVTRPDIILLTKWQKMLSWKYPGNCNRFLNNHKKWSLMNKKIVFHNYFSSVFF